MPEQGAPAVPPGPAPTQTITIQAPPSNGLAVASLVLGIISLFLFWIPFLGWLPLLLGLVFGFAALSRQVGRGMAIAGIACSGVALAFKLMFWLIVIGIFGAAAAHHGLTTSI